MTQTIEVQNKSGNPVVEEGEENVEVPAPNVMVYGYGPTKNPFYEQARALNTTPQGAVLILNAAVSRGQKLLLMNGVSPEPVEAQVIRTHTLDAQMFEAEVEFTVPQPDFWTTLRKPAKGKSRAEKRRSPRVSLPRGMTISWEGPYRRDISRVSSMSVGGLFIDAEDPAPVGETLRVQFDIPSGPVLAKAVVRRSIKGRGMGVEFTELPEAQRQALNHLMQTLLGNRRNRKS